MLLADDRVAFNSVKRPRVEPLKPAVKISRPFGVRGDVAHVVIGFTFFIYRFRGFGVLTP